MSIVNAEHGPTTEEFVGNGGLGSLIDLSVAGAAFSFDTFAEIKYVLQITARMDTSS